MPKANRLTDLAACIEIFVALTLLAGAVRFVTVPPKECTASLPLPAKIGLRAEAQRLVVQTAQVRP